jgi:hypothetical protein
MVGAGGLVLVVASRVNFRARLENLPFQVALLSIACGLAGYLFYGLGLPGSAFLESMTPGLRGLLIGFGCGLLPLAAVVWLSYREARG